MSMCRDCQITMSLAELCYGLCGGCGDTRLFSEEKKLGRRISRDEEHTVLLGA